jgi:O-antigen/teichoic acid export membrane protein
VLRRLLGSETQGGEKANASGSLWLRLGRGIYWNLIAAGFIQGSTFVLNFIMARILGRTIYGEYAMVQSTLNSMMVFGQMATGLTVIRYLAEFRSSDKVRAGRIMGLCSTVSLITASIAALALLGGANWMAASVLKAPYLSLGLAIGAIFLFFTAINGYQTGGLVGLENYRLLARAGILYGCLTVALCTLGAQHWGLNGAFAGLSISSVISWIIHHYFLKHASISQGIYLTYRGIWKEHGFLLKFALPAALSGCIMMPAIWLANAFLVRQPGGYSELALYSAAMNLRALIMFLPGNNYRVVHSLLSNQMGMGVKDHYRRTFWANILLNVASVVIVGGLVLTLAHKLLSFYGNTFTEAYPVLLILMAAAFIEAIALALYQLIQTLEKMWVSLLGIMLPGYGTFLVLAYFLTAHLGAKGLALSFTIGWCVNLLAATLWAWGYGFNIKTRQETVPISSG